MPKEENSPARRSARIAAANAVASSSNQHVAANESSKSKTESRKHSLLSLNDDCLLEVLDHLPIDDFSALKVTCQRFSLLTDYEAEKRLRKQKHVCPLKPYPALWHKKNLVRTSKMLANFGKFISHLYIDGTQPRNTHIDHQAFYAMVSMVKHCTSLKSLRLKKLDLHRLPIDEFKQALRAIKTLQLNDCHDGYTYSYIAKILKRSTSLKHFVLSGSGTSVETDICAAIVRFGQNLESIRFKRSCKYNVTTDEFLRFMSELRRMGNLKNLEICNIRRDEVIIPAIKILATSDSLETLRLSRFYPTNEFFAALTRFPNLRECKLHTDADIPESMRAAAVGFDFTVVKSEKEMEIYPFTVTIRRRN